MTNTVFQKFTAVPGYEETRVEMAHEAKSQLCGCADCKTAMEAGMRLAAQLLEHQCGYYVTQIAATMYQYARIHGNVMDIVENERRLGHDLTTSEISLIAQDNAHDHEERHNLMFHFLAKEAEVLADHAEAAYRKKMGYTV